MLETRLEGARWGNECDPSALCAPHCEAHRQSVQQFLAISRSPIAISSRDGPPTAQRPARRRRPRQLLRRGPSPAHRAVERVHPRRPPRDGARRHPHRPGHRAPSPRRARSSSPGPGASRRSSRRSPPTSPRCTTRSSGTRADRASSAPRPAGSCRRSSMEMAEQPPEGAASSIVDATTTSLLPQLDDGPPRPRRRQPARPTTPTWPPSACSTRTVCSWPRPATPCSSTTGWSRSRDLAGAPAAARAAGHRVPRPARPSSAPRPGVELVPQAEVDGMRLLASLAFQGFGAALLPASAAPSWVGGDWKRIPVDGLVGRSVGLATPSTRHAVGAGPGVARRPAVSSSNERGPRRTSPASIPS